MRDDLAEESLWGACELLPAPYLGGASLQSQTASKEVREKIAEMLLVFLHWVEANLNVNLKKNWEGQMR